jgi:hypothetical protein
MIEAKHSPGPWRLFADGVGGSTERGVESADGRHIVTVWRGSGCELADAALIAAAPDLLAELRDTALWLEGRAEVFTKLLADPAGWGRGAAATDKRQVIREEVARLQGRAFLIRQTISKAIQGGTS